MTSTSARWINEVIQQGTAQLLRSHRYKKKGRRFEKANVTSISHIDVQASQCNSSTQARFTLNVRCHFPSLEVASPDLSPNKSFTAAMATVGLRIGHLMPGHQDHWWIITADSNLVETGKSVRLAVEEYALPYLERVSTIEGIAEHGGYNPLIGRFPSLAVAAALAVLGRQDEALAMFKEYTAGQPCLNSYEQAWLAKYGIPR